MRPQILSDGTVWLSAPTGRDIDAIARICRHSSIGEWTTIPVPYTGPDALHFVDVIVPAGWASRSPTWAVRLAEDGEVVGMVALHLDRDDEATAEIGYWLAPSMRGSGLMTRAVVAACTFAFAPTGLRLERVDWRAFVGNYASAAVARRAGFRFEGMVRGGGVQRGVRRDEWIGGRLRTDPALSAPGWPAYTRPVPEPDVAFG